MNDSATHTPVSRLVPPGSTPLRELAHAIAAALTLPNDIVSQSEPAYLRVSRDRARVVLFAMRRVLADREISDSAIVGIANDIKYQAGVLEDGDASPADPFRAFVAAAIATLALTPADPPPAELAHLMAVRDRSRRVLAACRRAVQGPDIEDADLAAAIELLERGVGGGQGGEAAGGVPEMIP
jgi:hypothetical protein